MVRIYVALEAGATLLGALSRESPASSSLSGHKSFERMDQWGPAVSIEISDCSPRFGGAAYQAMIKVLLERSKGGWCILALESGETLEEQSSTELDEAAAMALDMADRHKAGTPELGDGVPPNALQDGEALRVARSAALHGGVS